MTRWSCARALSSPPSAAMRFTAVPAFPVRSSKVESLGECAFQYCTGLKTADCSAARITAIQKQTFYSCTSLEEATLPANLQTIGDWAFGNCTALAYLEIPRSVTEIA
ncbi:MAG: leucine-rich repeat domain-containing protein, partial [Ruminococcus sp.]|nr:leucine-rich repeat domain-containing protein [Ruminococcus sp.]